MSKRVVTLPNGKRCGLGVYVSAWRKLKALPSDAQISGFDHFPDDAGRILRQVRFGMHDRINRHIPGFGRGRKWHQDWQRHALQCAIAVNTPRLIVRWVPSDLRKRLAHRITQND